MSWNYRIVKMAVDPKHHTISGEFYYGLFEVYYDKNGRPNGRCEPRASFSASEPAEIVAGLELALRDATERTILNEWDISGLEGTAPKEIVT